MNEKLLKRVCDTPGIPGFEDLIQKFVEETLLSTCDEVRYDRIGNVIGLKKATKNAGDERPLRVILAAHAESLNG